MIKHLLDIKMVHADGRVITVPLHTGQDIGKGLFRKILRDIEMSFEEFKEYQSMT